MESPLAGRVCAIAQGIHVTISNITLARTANMIFSITREIHARSLASFYCQYADRHKFEIHATRHDQRAREGNSTICYHKKKNLMSVFHASVLLSTMNFVITLSK